MSDRVPNMLRHNFDDRDICRRCEGSLLLDGGRPCPGKPDPAPMQAPRIEIAVGDDVAWTTAGAGKVAHLYDDPMDHARIAVVHVAGWWVRSDGALTRTDTGVPAALEIVAADLRKGV